MRVIVTGSRTWTDREFLWGVLDSIAYQAAGEGYERLTLVHGACYPRETDGRRPDRSADWLAHLWADTSTAFTNAGNVLMVGEDPHPAKWKQCASTCPKWHGARRHCPTAGFRRNEHMVSLGADFCAAFIKGESRGTRHCADAAEAAGIPVERFEDQS